MGKAGLAPVGGQVTQVGRVDQAVAAEVGLRPAAAALAPVGGQVAQVGGVNLVVPAGVTGHRALEGHDVVRVGVKRAAEDRPIAQAWIVRVFEQQAWDVAGDAVKVTCAAGGQDQRELVALAGPLETPIERQRAASVAAPMVRMRLGPLASSSSDTLVDRPPPELMVNPPTST